MNKVHIVVRNIRYSNKPRWVYLSANMKKSKIFIVDEYKKRHSNQILREIVKRIAF